MAGSAWQRPSDARQTSVAGTTAPPLWVIGYQNEFGNDKLHIPPRPFLKPGVESIRDQIVKRLEAAIDAALTDNLAGAYTQLDAIGLAAQAVVKERIIAGLKPPLAARTLYKRKHRKKKPVERKSRSSTGAISIATFSTR